MNYKTLSVFLFVAVGLWEPTCRYADTDTVLFAVNR